MHRNVFGDAADKIQFRINGFTNSIRRKTGRNINDRGVGAGGFFRISYRIEYGNLAQYFFPGFTRSYTGYHIRAVVQRNLGMERSLTARNALYDEFRIFSYKY